MDPQSHKRPTRKKRKEDAQADVTVTSKDLVPSNAEGSSSGQTHNRRRGSRKLAGLLGMPLDILFEVFGHLHPYDLIKLARTNKDLRRLLLSKSSVSIWKTSLSNVPELPECPVNMSEPAWANLAFSPFCHFCATHTKTVDWLLRIRICSKCSKRFLVDLSEKIAELLNMGSEAGIPDTCRWFVRTRCEQRALKYLPSEYEEAMNAYSALQTRNERIHYLQERKQAIERDLLHAGRCELWAKLQEEARETELETIRTERLTAIVKKLEELGWGKDVASICFPDSLKTLKVVNRPQRLTEKIWANIEKDVLEYMEGIRKKRLKREYEATVQNRKMVATEVLRSYKNSRLSENTVMPEPPDFCELEPIKELVTQPAGVEVDLASFQPLISQLPAIIADWRGGIEQELLEIIKVVRNDSIDEEVAVYDYFSEEYSYRVPDEIRFPNRRLSEDQLKVKLRLASSVFRCRRCEPPSEGYSWCPDDWGCSTPMSMPMFYPQVLGHPCLTLQLSHYSFDSWGAPDPVCDPMLDLSRGDMQIRKRWSSRFLKFDLPGSKKAELVIKCCDLDPATATSEDLDRLNLRLACRACARDPKTGVIDPTKKHEDPLQASLVLPLFEWRAAVRHLIDEGHSHADFIKFKKEDLSENLLQAENDHRLKCNFEWFCVHCRDTKREGRLKTLERMKEHFRTSHTSLDPVMDQDYCRHFTAPDINASQPIFFVHLKDGLLSAFGPPEEDTMSLHLSTFGNLPSDVVQRAEKWLRAK